MSVKKKTNYISYEIKKLEKYLTQLQNYLDQNPPDLMTDRIEIMESARGNPIIKVIASKESQIKCWNDRFKEMPSLLIEINKLRKEVNEDKKEVTLRGGHDMPGFMAEADDEKEEQQETISNTKTKSTNKFDDDSFFENAEIISETNKELPPSTTIPTQEPEELPEEEPEIEQEDNDWLIDREDL